MVGLVSADFVACIRFLFWYKYFHFNGKIVKKRTESFKFDKLTITWSDYKVFYAVPVGAIRNMMLGKKLLVESKKNEFK